MARPKTYYVCSYDAWGQHSTDYTEIKATKEEIEELRANNPNKVYYDKLISAFILYTRLGRLYLLFSFILRPLQILDNL